MARVGTDTGREVFIAESQRFCNERVGKGRCWRREWGGWVQGRIEGSASLYLRLSFGHSEKKQEVKLSTTMMEHLKLTSTYEGIEKSIGRSGGGQGGVGE